MSQDEKDGLYVVPVDLDNLRSAMSSVIKKESDMLVQPIIKSDDGPADKQVLIRTTQEERERWKLAATATKNNLSTWIRENLNSAASLTLDCQHPTDQTRFYPWATICLKCGLRLWEKNPEKSQFS